MREIKRKDGTVIDTVDADTLRRGRPSRGNLRGNLRGILLGSDFGADFRVAKVTQSQLPDIIKGLGMEVME